MAKAEEKDHWLPVSYIDIIESRLKQVEGSEYKDNIQANVVDKCLRIALKSWQRIVASAEGEGFKVEDVETTMAVDNILYQTTAMQARLPYHLKEDPEYNEDDPPKELSYRVVRSYVTQMLNIYILHL